MSTSTEQAGSALEWRKPVIVLLNVVIYWVAIPIVLFTLGRLVDWRLDLAPPPWWIRWLGLVPLGGGGVLCGYAGLVLSRRGNGLPISSLPPTRLVRSGPYRILRHPIYTGFTALMAGVGLVLGSVGTALVAVPAAATLWFATWVKLYEEPGLIRRFGWAYRAHCRRTGLLLPFGWRRVARAVLLWLFRRFVSVTVERLDHCPKSGPAIYVSDHLSYFDFLLAASSIPGCLTIPVTAEVFRSPLGRFFAQLLGGVPKRRYRSDPDTARALAAELTIGAPVGIAVEGERSWTGQMGSLAPGVARFIARFEGPIVPVAMRGSYGAWPRWAPRANRSAKIHVRIGRPFRLRDELRTPSRAAVATLVRQRILALRSAAETAVDPSGFSAARPELALWRCPVCRTAETLSMQSRRHLVCHRCGARWEASSGYLTLVTPQDRAGERRTLAGWAALAAARAHPPLHGGNAIIANVEAELRTASADAPPAARLRSHGRGRVGLYADRLEWRSAHERHSLPLGDLTSVTTERADTLQLGTREHVVQLVLASSSPLRWQQSIEELQRRRLTGSPP